LSKKKIIYIHGGGDVIGGIEYHILDLVMSHKKYEAHLAIVKNGKYLDLIKSRGVTNLYYLGGGRLRNIYKTFRSIIKCVIYIKRRDIKLIIANGMHSWIYASLIAGLSGIKSICYYTNEISNGYGNLIDAIGLLSKPDVAIANSYYTARSISKSVKARTEVVYPFVDPSRFENLDYQTARSGLLAEFNLPSNAFIFIMVGRIQQWKGQDIVVSAFKKMSNRDNVILLIVGEYTFEKDRFYFENLQRMVEGHDSIIMTGYRDDVPKLIMGSDVLIHATITAEPFGIVLIESMIAGKPVVATSSGGPSEIIENYETGILYNPGNSDELCQIMSKLIDDANLRNKLSINSKKAVTERFSINNSISKLEFLISNLID